MLGSLIAPTAPEDLADTLTARMGPLRQDELITEAFLRRYAVGRAEFDRGEIHPEDQPELAMRIPDMCLEILALRAVVKGLCG